MVSAQPSTECDPVARLESVLAREAPDWRSLVVAFSGGPDSSVLLAAASRIAPRRRLRAVHVDHGWHPESARWAERCRALARTLGVRCQVERLDARPESGEGPEAAARRARYERLAGHVGRGDVLLTAHHRDDQAETLLLALLRGGGVHGWSGMPVARPFGDGGLHLRPWLELARDELRQWQQRWGLECIDDPANADPRFERVWLRQSVLPLLRERWASIDATLARAAAQAGEAAAAVDLVAAHDFTRCRGRLGDTIDCAALADLPASRQRALLRWWIARGGLPRPPSARLGELLQQLHTARPDRNPRVAWPGGEVRRWRGEAWLLAPQAPIESGTEFRWDDPRRPLALPDRVLPGGLLEQLGVELPPGVTVRVRYRRGGERLRLAGTPRERALKTLLTERGVPPWERDRLPLIYVDGRLAAVPGLGRALPAEARD